jgi:anti-anti-sigma factor
MDSSRNSFSVTLESINGNVIVALVGELDLDTAPELARALDALLDEGPPAVVIECSALGFIDSSGIAVLVGAQKRLQSQERHLVVRSLRPHALRIFETVGLVEFLNVEAEPSSPQIS